MIFSLEAETAKTATLGIAGVSFIALLLVLKFAKSLISKLLLIIILVGIGVVAFGQRESLTACVNGVRAQAKAGASISTRCTILGREVTISLPTGT